MNKFIACWLERAAAILETELKTPVNLLPGAALPAEAASVTWMVDLAGDWEGTFTATVEGAALEALCGAPELDSEAAEPAAERWERLFKRICIEAAEALGAASGRSCEVAMISSGDGPAGAEAMGYQLHAGGQMMVLLIADRVEAGPTEPLPERTQPPTATAESPGPTAAPAPPAASDSVSGLGRGDGKPPASSTAQAAQPAAERIQSPGIELLLDVELEASLRFGSREMALSELLALGPGDVVQLDRALADPVDLIVGDRIVARGEVVLVNGNFGLHVTEVAEPRKSLESIRCLF
jgi:flagellar motor switch protein FliN/FliY